MGQANEPGAEPAAEPAAAPAAAAGAHPEEMRAELEVTVRDKVRCRLTFRTTPAGLAAVALMIAAVTVPLGMAVRGRRRDWKGAGQPAA